MKRFTIAFIVILTFIMLTGCQELLQTLGLGQEDNTENVYTVTYDSQSATTPADPDTQTVVSPATTVGALPTSPENTGFVFSGWYTETEGSGSEFTASTEVTGDITVYAKWNLFIDNFNDEELGSVWVTAYNGEGVPTVVETGSELNIIVSEPSSGVNNYVMDLDASFDLSNDLSIEWRFMQEGKGGTRVYLKDATNGGVLVRFAIDTDDLPYIEVITNNGGGNENHNIESSTPWLNAYHIFKIVKSGTSYSYYVDDILKATYINTSLDNVIGAIQISVYSASWKSGGNNVTFDYFKIY